MKKITKRIISVLLVCMMMLSALTPASFALTADKEWENFYKSYMDEGSAVFMSPGSNDTERNFTWYSPINAGSCSVLVSENSDFSNARNYSGTYVKTPQGDRSNKVTVTGLKADTTYYYKCITDYQVSETATFSTLSSTSFTAMYVTDIHLSTNDDGDENSLMNHAYTFNEVAKEAQQKANNGLDLVISSGDQATYGLRKEYMSLASSTVLDSVPFALCVGNHDRKGSAYKYFNNNPNKYEKGLSSYIGNDYWYVKGNVLFMVFDSNSYAAQTHYAFAKSAVKANPDVKWRVAVMHHDMYGRLTDGRLDDASQNRRPAFRDIFDDFGIDIAFLGHSHYYSMSNAVYNNKTAMDLKGKDSVTDAPGTICFVSGSINHPRGDESTYDIPLCDENAYAYVSKKPIYNIVDFSDNSVTVKSYELDGDEPFNSFTINKTTNDGGHPEAKTSPFDFVTRMWHEFRASFEEFGIMVKVIFNNKD